jgi:hypothetical protein
MKNIVYIMFFLFAFSTEAQSQLTQIKTFLKRPEVILVKDEFLKSSWRIEGGIGTNFQILPSRLNIIEYNSDIVSKEDIKNSLGIAPGLALALNINPIQNKFLSYQYQVKYSESWLFPMSASSQWRVHHIALGYDFLFFTMNFEKSKLSYTYKDESTGILIDKVEEKSNSYYESTANSYGIQWLMNKENGRSLELRKINKKFTNFTSDDSKGYGIYFRNKNSVLQFEYIPKHAINADSYVKENILKDAKLLNTSSYFHFSFIKYFGFESDYPNTRKKLFYF